MPGWVICIVFTQNHWWLDNCDMYNGKKILGLIPARGGSKGIKNKNIRELCGKPLIGYTIEAANGSEFIDDVVVTTDSKDIADCAQKYGAEVPFMRPESLAADNSKTIDAVLHAIQTLKEMGREYDSLVLLQPTEPLRTAKHIDEALKVFYSKGEQGVVSISEVDDNPILIRSLDSEEMLIPLLTQNSTCRRQDMPNFYRVNGCIYINKVSEIDANTSLNDNRIPYIMDRKASVDIDEEMDLRIAEMIINEKLAGNVNE